eukprot:Pompholyxophrys_punicea_v1_NODE_385_length_2081_cov_2.839585.p2 type:complete len:108 gc:universal NODE_385_length_2081_cov_2.839585:397-720(+)
MQVTTKPGSGREKTKQSEKKPTLHSVFGIVFFSKQNWFDCLLVFFRFPKKQEKLHINFGFLAISFFGCLVPSQMKKTQVSNTTRIVKNSVFAWRGKNPNKLIQIVLL